MSTMSYDLQVINNKDLTQFYNGNETDEESLMNFLKLSVKHWRQNDRNYKIFTYPIFEDWHDLGQDKKRLKRYN